ncbi:MAG: MMPL family transporter [Ruminococcus sp.]|nr:MMPL family transporter [Ruminococcus sp.]
MKQKGIIIELTSLLDVILIMLFFVMMQSGQQSENAIKEADERVAKAQQEVQEQKRKAKSLADALSGFEGGELYELKISFDETSDVLVLSFAGDEIDRLGFEQTEEIERAVRSIEVPEGSAVLAAVIYDGNNVLYRDMESIRAALDKLSKENDNIYIGYIDTSIQ